MIDLRLGNCLEEIIPQDAIIVSDPPFNIGYKYNTYKDRMKEDEYFQFLSKVFRGGELPCVVVHYPESLYHLSMVMGKVPDKVISWVYNSNTGKQHRDIAFFSITPDMSKVTQPYKNPNDKRVRKLIESGRTGAKLYDWWNINQVKNVSKDKTKHPCQMPIEVMERIVGILPDGATICDPFMGSGTTGVACKKLNRDFIGIELDEEYFRIAKERIETVDCKGN